MLANKPGPWKIEFPDGETYEGDVVRGKAHGNGKYTYADGSIYEGQWKDDRYHGHGKMIANGCIYGGQWVNGKEHGKGVSIYHSAEHAAKKEQQDVVDHDGKGEDIDIHSQASAADIYNGEFKNGMRDGVGTYKYSNGRTYEGQWKEGIYHGQGTETYADGRIYVGAWHNDTKHGMGSMSYTNGDCYKGSWSHDAMLEGTYTFANYDNGTCPIMKMYQGQFEGGYFNGMGTCWYTNGDIYKGQWKDDCQHGEGKMVYCDTTNNDNDNDHNNGHNDVVYEGDWIVGKRHGHGKLTQNSTVYEGDWSDDKKQGMGTLTDKSNGDVVEQVYYNDELVAIAKNNHGSSSSSSLSKGKGGGGFRYCYDDFKISCIEDNTSNHDVQDDNSLIKNGRSNGNNEEDEEGSVLDGRINISTIATCGCEHDYGYSCQECIREQHSQAQAKSNDNIGGKQLLLPKRIAFLIELLEHKFPVNEEEEYSTFQWLLQGKYPANVNTTTTRLSEGGGSAGSTPTSANTSEHKHIDSSTMMVDHQYKLKKKRNKKMSSSSSSSSISKKKVQQEVDGILIEGCNIPEINGKYDLIVDECFSVSTTASTYDTTAASSSIAL